MLPKDVTASGPNTAPVITSNGGGATASVSVAENTSAVTSVTATDTDLPAQTLTYSISGGADQALLSVDASSGVLSFVSAPDYEAPTDTGGNNVYDVTVQVSDGNGGTDSQAIAVAIINVNEAPVIGNLSGRQSPTPG
ncbi:MAG: cadherin repeat domain-containing protein [Hydrogenophilales bacterium]|nr:cadherin repeat domain-containing protein [Hydrogenophilales bacterium]